jgi:hypothetical protein
MRPFTPRLYGHIRHQNKYPLRLPTRFNADTRILVQSTCGDTSTILTCSDDTPGCTNLGSITEAVSMTAGTTYYVVLGGFGPQDYGPGNLTVTLATPTTSPTRRPTRAPVRICR